MHIYFEEKCSLVVWFGIQFASRENWLFIAVSDIVLFYCFLTCSSIFVLSDYEEKIKG